MYGRQVSNVAEKDDGGGGTKLPLELHRLGNLGSICSTV